MFALDLADLAAAALDLLAREQRAAARLPAGPSAGEQRLLIDDAVQAAGALERLAAALGAGEDAQLAAAQAAILRDCDPVADDLADLVHGWSLGWEAFADRADTAPSSALVFIRPWPQVAA